MADQSDGMIRDSDIKFECRILLSIVSVLPKELQDELLDPIHNIIKLENKRLDALRLPQQNAPDTTTEHQENATPYNDPTQARHIN